MKQLLNAGEYLGMHVRHLKYLQQESPEGLYLSAARATSAYLSAFSCSFS